MEIRAIYNTQKLPKAGFQVRFDCYVAVAVTFDRETGDRTPPRGLTSCSIRGIPLQRRAYMQKTMIGPRSRLVIHALSQVAGTKVVCGMGTPRHLGFGSFWQPCGQISAFIGHPRAVSAAKPRTKRAWDALVHCCSSATFPSRSVLSGTHHQLLVFMWPCVSVRFPSKCVVALARCLGKPAQQLLPVATTRTLC